MEGLDAVNVFYSESLGGDAVSTEETSRPNWQNLRARFLSFLLEFHLSVSNTLVYTYRDALRTNYNLGEYSLEVCVEDISAFDDTLADHIYKRPTDMLPLLESAATEAADQITAPRPEGEEEMRNVQVTLRSKATPISMRALNAEHVAKLVKVPGIVVAASSIRSKATRMSIQCRSCRVIVPNIELPPGLEGYTMPRKCHNEQSGGANRPGCPLDPFFIMPEKCVCVDFQTLKLQESPDSVPHGDMPRHLSLYMERSMCDKVVPGNRVTVVAIYAIRKTGKSMNKKQSGVGVRSGYLRVLGVEVENDGGEGRTAANLHFSSEEEETFRRLAANPDIYEVVAKSIAPSIFGSDDIKKAIACLLFGGSRKVLPDGLIRRGDINVLLLGDPGTAKSQLLKFVERVAPIAVYTSGKGSSAAGLTASVLRDPSSRNFVVEGGAMVLADGGVVCIDEFDKMREDDRVAIHEAMEQQTISIAKAGITTTLNSRCAVLAAANSIFGRWDDTKADENIDFMPTILSRFDCIFIVKDEHNEKRDMTLAKHVIGVHVNSMVATATNNNDTNDANGLSVEMLKKFIAYCRSHCGPRLDEKAGDKLKNQYVLMRAGTKQIEEEIEKRLAIPITVRQLEALVRMAEALAKMQLMPFANEQHVAEALRLFHVSTLDAASSGNLAGVEGFITKEDQEAMDRIEKQVKKRFAIGTQTSVNSIVNDFKRQQFSEQMVMKVLYFMIRRGELEHRLQRRMLIRIK